jgi:hypothetical protein
LDIKEIRERILETMGGHGPFTIQDVCRELHTEDDFRIVMAVSELEDDGRVEGRDSLQIFREDGGAILLSRYEVVQ